MNYHYSWKDNKYNQIAKRYVTIYMIVFVSMLALLFLAFIRVGIEVRQTTALISEPAKIVNVKAGNIPNPCGLTVVECEGEKKEVKPVAVKKEVIPVIAKGTRPIKIGATKEVQAKVDYAWSISHDKDFIYTAEYENGGTWDVNKLSGIIGSNGYRDIGICQINKGYHKTIVNDKNFKDWKWQIKKCHELYTGGTTFYGYFQRHKVVNKFKWI